MEALKEDLRAPSRWPVLDGVRGVAVIAVAAFHALRLLVLENSVGVPSAWPLATARFGLDAFFVLSGLLIVESWRANRRRAETWFGAAREYVRRRAARILPAYWVSLVVLVPLVAGHLLRSPSDLALLAGLQGYVRPGLPSEVNVVYWSLTTEMHFYVLAPLLAWGARRLGAHRLVVVGVLAAVAWQLWAPGAGLPKSLLPGRLDQFAMGALVATLLQRDGHRLVRLVQHRFAGWTLAVSLLGLGVWQGAVLDGQWRLGHVLIHSLVGVVVGLLLLRSLTMRPDSGVLASPRLRFAGLVSYGVYLWHFPVMLGLRHALGLEGATPAPAVALAATVLMLAASFIAGTASYILIERPFLRGFADLDLRAALPAVLGRPKTDRELATT